MQTSKNKLRFIAAFIIVIIIGLAGVSCEGPMGPEGPQGPQGEQGPPGPVGPAGNDGSIILAGQGVPEDNTGKPGDFYLDLTTGNLYGPKMSEGWGTPTNLQGPQGPTGPQGPPGVDGEDGQNGQDGQDGEDGKNGKDGQDGEDGQDGQDGEDGSQIYAGSGTPAGNLGKKGDYYLDKVNYDLYGPKTGSGWGSPVNLQGPQGDQGSAGPQGADGVSGWERVGSSCGTLLAGTTSGITITCPIDKKVLGGGVARYTDSTCSTPRTSYASSFSIMTHNGPSSDTEWTVGIKNVTVSSEIHIRFWAICATVN